MPYLSLTKRVAQIRCPHCGEIDWNRSPELAKTVALIATCPKGILTHQLAKELGISLDLASHRASALVRAGAIASAYFPNPAGGRRRKFYPLVGTILNAPATAKRSTQPRETAKLSKTSSVPTR